MPTCGARKMQPDKGPHDVTYLLIEKGMRVCPTSIIWHCRYAMKASIDRVRFAWQDLAHTSLLHGRTSLVHPRYMLM